MIEDPQGVKSSFSEKMRLIRFRRKKENLRFWQEFKLVPRWLIWMVLVLFLIAQIIGQMVLHHQLANHQEVFGPELDSDPGAAGAALFAIITGVSLVFAVMIFMVGYVNKDAKRRGMHSALWTFLVLVLMPGYLVLGFIIYLLMREPLPYNCPQCGTTVGARFNFCPTANAICIPPARSASAKSRKPTSSAPIAAKISILRTHEGREVPSAPA